MIFQGMAEKHFGKGSIFVREMDNFGVGNLKK